jgi:signal transduction histidine kinase
MAAAPVPPARPRAVAARRRALTLTVAQLAGAGLLAALVELALFYSGPAAPRPPWVAALFPVYALVYFAAGALASLRRPGSRIGQLLTLGGFTWIVAGLSNTAIPALQAAGLVVATVPIAVVMHLLVAFPSGSLRTAAERAIAAMGYAVCLVLQVPLYVFAAGGPLQLADRPELVDAGRWAQRGVGAAVVVIICAVLVRRLGAATDAQRRVLAPLAVYGIVAILVIPLGSTLADVFGRGLALPFGQLTIMAGVPVAFAVGVLRGGFARTAGVEELAAWLGADEDGGRRSLADALRAALGDDSVELLFRVPGETGWVSPAGVGVAAPVASPQRGVAEVRRGDAVIGAIVYDAVLLPRPHDVREAARIVVLALDHERLTVELRASRLRLVEASDAERRRIARDLHDGLQSRLVFLAVQAGVGGQDELHDGLQKAIDELRDLVHGVMPAALTERGLPAAVEGLTDRLAVAVELEVAGLEQRLPPAVESTGFFVVAEALVNATKHARAGALRVALDRDLDGRLRIDVDDDGVGGAGHGHGTRSMQDRVEALGGSLRIDSVAGRGTHVRAELPCGS